MGTCLRRVRSLDASRLYLVGYLLASLPCPHHACTVPTCPDTTPIGTSSTLRAAGHALAETDIGDQARSSVLLLWPGAPTLPTWHTPDSWQHWTLVAYPTERTYIG